jgi:putative metallohydrolase (TIGR04338 family)
MRDRDNQRSRLYKAQHETAWIKEPSKYAKPLYANLIPIEGYNRTPYYVINEKPHAPSLEGCQQYYDNIIKRAWFSNRWINHYVIVTKGNGASALGRTIRLSYWGRKEWVLLHELAHTLTPRDKSAHGKEFAGILLFLVQQVMGKAEADKLREAFKKNKVKYNYSAVPPVRKQRKMCAV